LDPVTTLKVLPLFFFFCYNHINKALGKNQTTAKWSVSLDLLFIGVYLIKINIFDSFNKLLMTFLPNSKENSHFKELFPENVIWSK